MIPGPSGLQKKHTSSMPVKKRNNYYESDDDYDSDEIIAPPLEPPSIILPSSAISETQEVKDATLAAPHLQLDWLSDSSSQGGVETDDDVIFVSDRAEPIDLTADSDSENDARARNLRLPSSIEERNVDRSNGDVPNPTVNPVWSPHIEAPRPSHVHCITR